MHYISSHTRACDIQEAGLTSLVQYVPVLLEYSDIMDISWSLSQKWIHGDFYRSPKKLREFNVFSLVFQSVCSGGFPYRDPAPLPHPHHTRTPLPTPKPSSNLSNLDLTVHPYILSARRAVGILMWVSTVLITLNFRISAWSNDLLWTCFVLCINNKHKVVRKSHEHSLRLNISLLELGTSFSETMRCQDR